MVVIMDASAQVSEVIHSSTTNPSCTVHTRQPVEKPQLSIRNAKYDDIQPAIQPSLAPNPKHSFVFPANRQGGQPMIRAHKPRPIPLDDILG